MATLGLVVFADPLSGGLERLVSRFVAQERLRSLSKPISAYLLFTLAALIMTLPVMVYHFQRLSLTALLLEESGYAMLICGWLDCRLQQRE
jgi:predicted membrane metal-binding protein